MAKTILVTEDFEDARDFMKSLLEHLGYRVIEAENGWQAVEAVRKHVPDLILMDMALPKTDGIAATKMIRKLEKASTVPIIAITASGEFIYDQAMEAGCNELLTKPIEIEELQSVLEKYLG